MVISCTAFADNCTSAATGSSTATVASEQQLQWEINAVCHDNSRMDDQTDDMIEAEEVENHEK